MKLDPMIKLIGNSILSLNTKFTFFLIELFWMPIKSIKNNVKLDEIIKKIFFTEKNII